MYSIRDILILGLVAASLPFCLARPFYGVAVWTIISFLNPHEYAWGAAKDSSIALAVAIPTLVGFCLFSRNWGRLLCREVVLMVILWLWFTATTFNSVHDPVLAHNAASAWYKWNLVSKILLMTIVTVGIVNSFERLRRLALVIAGCFGLLVAKAVPFMILSGGSFRLYGPDNSMISDNNDFGLALNMVLPFLFFLAKTETNKRIRAVMIFLFMATIPGILFTYSRGALVGLLAVLFCMMLQVRQKFLLILVALCALLFAAFLTPQAWRDRMTHGTPDALDASAQSRLNAWTYCWRLAANYPLMGGGFDAFSPALFDRYAPNPKDVHGPHSVYFGVLAEHGFTGLFLYITFVLCCFGRLRRMSKMARLMGNEKIGSYAAMLRMSLIGFLASGAFLGRAYFDFFFSVVACIAILAQVCQSEWVKVNRLPVEAPESEEPAGLVPAESGA